ncbi:hypothetical protein H0274_15255 [Altererythrobacter sp. CC-YST694]|uniref:hypothetical protein n=1 Tax=Altererythrobacter sp. CC-YST694 TaxID=2755038 RepID=UPI001D021F07|nr:hypothetical protein [Altererythrobacter sp. CC-YST694]MCB5426618.1 hypothetical protein [Altererythrobacter sp. CC-YST694]
MAFWHNVSPTGAVKDFAHLWRNNPHRWPVLAVSIAGSVGLMAIIIPKSERIIPRQPEVTYITTYAAGRSDAEILASNLANQKKQDVLRAQEAEREEYRKNLYRQLGRMTGVDVDKMEREIKQEQAAEEAAIKAKAEQARTGQAQQAAPQNAPQNPPAEEPGAGAQPVAGQ